MLFKFLFFLFFAIFLQAQEIGKQLQLDINPQYYNNGNIKFFGDVGFRKDFTYSEWIRYTAKPTIAYGIGTYWTLLGGMGIIYTDNNDINNVEINNRIEVRPFQGVKFTHDLSARIKMQYYARLEERFDYNTETWESLNSLRFRFRIRSTYQFDAYRKGRYYRAMFSFEGFQTIEGTAGQINERSRVTLGLERSFNYNQRGRVEVTWERQELSFWNKEYSDIYLKLSYYPAWGEVRKNRVKNEE